MLEKATIFRYCIKLLIIIFQCCQKNGSESSPHKKWQIDFDCKNTYKNQYFHKSMVTILPQKYRQNGTKKHQKNDQKIDQKTLKKRC